MHGSGLASSSRPEQSRRFAVLRPPDARELNSWRTGHGVFGLCAFVLPPIVCLQPLKTEHKG